jgi:predicted lipid carrier protein YhbT
VIGSAIVNALDALNLRFPRADRNSLQEFKKVREALEQEGRVGGQKIVKKVGPKRPARK